ncbi:MAG: hypothetical protein LH473_13820 [Chitinophagales bacterium]|nr:hypothetical protein [Chitinophagales bacterium]
MNELQTIAAVNIQSNFDLEEITGDEKTFDKIRVLLIDKINFLLDHNFEKLLWLLYRIDVSEEKAKAALAENTIQKPSEVLADLIIERQIEKAKTRIQYRAEHNNDRGDF